MGSGSRLAHAGRLIMKLLSNRPPRKSQKIKPDDIVVTAIVAEATNEVPSIGV
jgi:hypothetical protein